MSLEVIVKYYANSEIAKAPYKATDDAAGNDLFAAEAKTLFPGSITMVSTELKWSIPKGYFVKFFSRSGFLRDHFVSCDGGVIDVDYQGEVMVLISNHSPLHHKISIGDRVVKPVLFKKYDVKFVEVEHPARHCRSW